MAPGTPVRQRLQRTLDDRSIRGYCTAQDVERLVAGVQSSATLGGDLLGATTFADFKERAERAYILAKLREHDWNVSETARAVDMPRSNLYKKIERYGLMREEA